MSPDVIIGTCAIWSGPLHVRIACRNRALPLLRLSRWRTRYRIPREISRQGGGGAAPSYRNHPPRAWNAIDVRAAVEDMTALDKRDEGAEMTGFRIREAKSADREIGRASCR